MFVHAFEQFSQRINLLKMKSTIRIEFDFNTNQPVLRIKSDFESDDLRDQMLKNFLEKSQLEGAVMYISYPYVDNSITDIRCETNAIESRKELSIIDTLLSAKSIAWANCEVSERDYVDKFFDSLITKLSVRFGNLKE